MANTKSSSKRARQSLKKQSRNKRNRSVMKTKVKSAVDAISKKDAPIDVLKSSLKNASRALSKAASKGAIPKKRAARKIGKLARLVKKATPKI